MDNKHEMQARRNALAQLLANSDYKAIKASEGTPSKDWDEVKANRAAWREEINTLDEQIEAAEDETGETV